MAQHILCAISYQNPSFNAVRWAVDMAIRLHVHLTILSTYRLNITEIGQDVMASRNKIEEEIREVFLKIENEILKDCSISYDFKSEVGFLRDRVEYYSKNKGLLFLIVANSPDNTELAVDSPHQIGVPMVIIP